MNQQFSKKNNKRTPLRDFLESQKKESLVKKSDVSKTPSRPKDSLVSRFNISVDNNKLPSIKEFINSQDQFPKHFRNNPYNRYFSNSDGINREILIPDNTNPTCNSRSYLPRVTYNTLQSSASKY